MLRSLHPVLCLIMLLKYGNNAVISFISSYVNNQGNIPFLAGLSAGTGLESI